MKKEDNSPQKYNAITALHRVLELPKPLHPLISLIDNTAIKVEKDRLPAAFIFDFYKISFKEKMQGRIKYGQNYYDFEEGSLVFTAPGQVMAVADDTEYMGKTLLFHPEFIRNYPLGQQIKNYGFFSYTIHEALHLSEKEKEVIEGIFSNMNSELDTNIDDFSQDIMVSQIELLLNYSNRFYKRQFITRKAVNNDLLAKLDDCLNDHFNDQTAVMKGLPSVQELATKLHVSPGYLSDMLRSLTGQNTQQHIHNKIIEKAKEILSHSNLSVAEIAYQLGFERPQSFNKLFKQKTTLSPLEYRKSFN
ncbi:MULTISPECIES: helix-turn-helix domain-containing protein [Niastella]|uniref:Helix-turn-helix transcriptional regulator n=1 Tax=Niastella soli TaxID=2821487 RepID=A0ABS3Z2Q5_9BACT|nr:AraC family transcriptional regulator [Niastella soli]MBO9203681.1 helix-turn-helix transcriptional regulator [Niastella soli]